MIRINLRRRQHIPGARLWIWMVVIVAVTAGGLGGLYWIDQRVPLVGAWRRLWQPEVMEPLPVAVEPESAVRDLPVIPDPEVLEEVPDVDLPPDPEEEPDIYADPVTPAPVDEPLVTPTPPDEPSTDPEDYVGLPEAELPAPEPPVRPPVGLPDSACETALKIATNLPGDLRLTDLTCRDCGEYSLEGVSVSRQPMKGFLSLLERSAYQVELSWWHTGSCRPGHSRLFHFRYMGSFDTSSNRPLDVLTPAQAAALDDTVAAWARQAQLEHFAGGEPVELTTTSAQSRQRRQVWGIGSYAQVLSFMQQIVQTRNSLVLNEAVIVPIHDPNGGPARARLYGRLEYLVTQP